MLAWHRSDFADNFTASISANAANGLSIVGIRSSANWAHPGCHKTGPQSMSAVQNFAPQSVALIPVTV